MAKRLEVILKDAEYREFQRIARSRHMSLAAWVREALDAARHRETVGDVETKLAAVRAAAQLSVAPSPEIDVMLEEIERGYLSDRSM
ncbi:MAG TPA: antitoxin [Terriglobia bacterium]|nr:antitoxin [Terriglobia bacterium]